MKANRINKRQVTLKIDADLDNYAGGDGKKLYGSKIAVYEEAVRLLETRHRIEKHVTDSLDKNMGDFGGDFAGFCDYLKANDKFSNYGGMPQYRDERGNRITQYDKKSFIYVETFNLLRQWNEREPKYRERFMQEVVYRLEFWLHPDSLQPFLFPDDFPEEQAGIKEHPVRKAEATA